jgi:hypothetical protein
LIAGSIPLPSGLPRRTAQMACKSPNSSCPDFDPGIHFTVQRIGGSDCRVKPGNDAVVKAAG